MEKFVIHGGKPLHGDVVIGGAKNAGIILGAKVPIVLVRRAASAPSKLASIALGSVLAARMDLA